MPLHIASSSSSPAAPLPRWSASFAPDRLLARAAQAWCLVALAGQAMFAAYVIAFYGRAAIAGRPQDWNKVLGNGHVPGEPFGNALVGLHLVFTVVIVIGGALQLMPALRRIAPAVHRWNGRLYVIAAIVLALGGFTMLATRGTVGSTLQHLAVSLNALLVLLFAANAWRHAIARRLEAHRRWALRLFLAVAGVWFFRIGLMAWLVLNQGPVGFDPKTFTGPFLDVLGFAQYLLPLAVLETWFRVRAHGGPAARLVLAAALAGLTLLTALGIGAASVMMWLPRM